MGLRALIAEDQALLREGLARLLSERGVEVVSVAENLADTLRKARAYRPDVVLADLRMPPEYRDEGLRAAVELGAEDPPIGVLILSQHAEPEMATQLLEERSAGVGYLLKDRVGDSEVLVDALSRVAEGQTVVDPKLVAPLVGAAGEADALSELSSREREVVSLMAQGRSNAGICRELFLGPKTVESHVRSIFLKLGLPPSPDDSRRVLAVLTWLRAPARR